MPFRYSIRPASPELPRFLRAARLATITASLIGLTLVLSVDPAGQVAPQPGSPPAPQAGASTFTVFINAVPIGVEQVALTRTSEGWTILSTARFGPPLDIAARRVQIRYTAEWKPIDLAVDATRPGQEQSLRTVVEGSTARSQTSTQPAAGQTTGGQPAEGQPAGGQPARGQPAPGPVSEKSDTIEPDAILLPNPFIGPYEALSMRLKTAAPGSTLPAYSVLQASMTVRVGESSREQIQTPGRIINARRTRVTLAAPGRSVDADIWSDENGRLLRISVPAQNLDEVRQDVASVASRRLTMVRSNDERVSILANGFSLAATISRPIAQPPSRRQLPAVVLVGGSGPTDRDEIVFNIPIFAQLAGAIADAGYLVVRYDKRGIGQSGGRVESATLPDFADDLRSVVRYLDQRKDVDKRRIAVVGYSEGGTVAMIHAAKDKHSAALVLVSAIGTTGAELNLAQVAHAADRAHKSDAERQTTIDLQKKIQNAVLTGSGWDGISPAIRKQADTPWFQSFLAFDPTKVMPNIRQPILIVQGELDTQVVPSNADRLAALARARKKPSPVEVVKVPGVNHLLVPASTGEVDEYGSLAGAQVSPDVTKAIVDWLGRTMANVITHISKPRSDRASMP